MVNYREGVVDTRLGVKAKDTKKFRGQGQAQTLSRPRLRTKDTGASVLQKKKFFKFFFFKVLQNFFSGKKVFKHIFSGDLYLRKTKKGLRKFSAGFQAFSSKISTVQKLVLSSSLRQGNFRELEASKPRT